MKQFMNNRVGTILTEQEVSNIRKDVQLDFHKGQIVVYEVYNDTYIFALYIKTNSNAQATILIRDQNKEIISKDVPNGNLYAYSQYETVTQHYKTGDTQLNEEGLLETYIIQNN